MVDPYPAGPEQPHRPPTKGEPPASVKTAISLIWAGVGLSILSSLLSIVFIDDLIDDVIGADSSIDRDAAQVGVIVGTVFSIAFGVGLAILFIFFLKKGANWARIVYTVLLGIGIVVGVVGLLGSQPVVFLLLGLVGLVLNIATIVFLFRPDSNAFFSAPTPTY
ncbi:MAG: hypothetical protein EON52_15785 [Actinomycetales bacterium]|nr:MAG: hypothetical protein EON52_15785 [Actinomycetales bacterium]